MCHKRAIWFVSDTIPYIDHNIQNRSRSFVMTVTSERFDDCREKIMADMDFVPLQRVNFRKNLA